MEHRLAPGTHMRYLRWVADLRRVGYEPTELGLRSRVLDQTPITTETLDRYPAAVQHYRLFNGFDPIPEEEMEYIRRLIQGRARLEAAQGLQPRRQPRGAITQDMLLQLVAWMRKNGKSDEEVNSVLICWATGLRTSQMSELRWKDFCPSETGRWALLMPKIHDPTAVRRGGRLDLVYTEVHTIAHAFLTIQKIAKDGKAHVAPNWKPYRVISWVKAAAKEYGWTTELKWVAHSLRHGLAAEIYDITNNEVAARDATGHAGAMVRWYMRSNAVRIAESRRALNAKVGKFPAEAGKKKMLGES